MKLTREGINNTKEWEDKGYILPKFAIEPMIKATHDHPVWVHFGAGNIFRAFMANAAQKMLDAGKMTSGIVAVDGFDYEIIEKQYRPHDNLSVLVTLKADGSVEKKVIASIGESCILDRDNEKEFSRLKEIFANDSLQFCSFTITEKGYALQDRNGNELPAITADFNAGPQKATGYLGKVASLLVWRYQNGKKPVAMVSMDNCSRNGEKLYTAMDAFAHAWVSRGFVDDGFLQYIESPSSVSFPWSMIDKITPRPHPDVQKMIEEDGLELNTVVTSKGTYCAPFVNAEECEYLVIEDLFPAGRPALQDAGLIFTDRATVEKAERMKVGTCLNPLHTSLAIYGCLLGYTRICDEMKDPDLVHLIKTVGYVEGLPVATDPKILNPKEFIDAVVYKRLPNPFMPDTPQRIATDTSQKLSVRFGETVKAYVKLGKVHDLHAIPLVYAGWLRYLLAIDDEGKPMELSDDPLKEKVQKELAGISFGETDLSKLRAAIVPVLKDSSIFGLDLEEAGLADEVVADFAKLNAKTGAVRSVLHAFAKQA
ncbi:MAG: mannitol dehydrogenase family protein [Galactobacillus timonensis]|uniref:mannitol dehydrogenase family protein n=1 Tax=Galactobacillus timonensis TaxID=2041840 RepID=UPI002409F7C1|nr:mannitol dehydrogenase family protein [Galactobacillus timonensis]MDD6599809.1 mannitol dehydrogenase family protein [Galactobacillus timonensis]